MINSLTGTFLICLVLLFLYMSAVFVLATAKKNNSIVDVAYGGAFILIALVTLMTSSDIGAKQLLAASLVTIWGLRLAVHVGTRNWGKEEDFRYKKWRDSWGKFFLIRSFLQTYMLQGLIVFVVSLPVILINSSKASTIGLFDLGGMFVWVVGFLFETVGDFQLSTFIKNPVNKGKLMTKGLWQYTRHPNYFGEATLWWGLFLIALPVPYSFLAVFSPVLIDFLLLKVSGIPLLEEKYKGRADFEEYKLKTSAFFPMLPKR